MDLLFSSGVDEIETMLNAELSGSKIIEAATINDTLTVPTGKSGEGFEDVFFNETACYYLRISASKLMQSNTLRPTNMHQYYLSPTLQKSRSLSKSLMRRNNPDLKQSLIILQTG